VRAASIYHTRVGGLVGGIDGVMEGGSVGGVVVAWAQQDISRSLIKLSC
jgi:hypothetical protein